MSAPATGTDLPVVLFSHGNGWHLDGYAPLASFWASHGFVVVQPTHLDSRRNGFGFDHPLFPTIWTERITDLIRVLDQLDTVEAALPGLPAASTAAGSPPPGTPGAARRAQSLLGARILDDDGQPRRGPIGGPRHRRRPARGHRRRPATTCVPFAAEQLPVHAAVLRRTDDPDARRRRRPRPVADVDPRPGLVHRRLHAQPRRHRPARPPRWGARPRRDRRATRPPRPPTRTRSASPWCSA